MLLSVLHHVYSNLAQPVYHHLTLYASLSCSLHSSSSLFFSPLLLLPLLISPLLPSHPFFSYLISSHVITLFLNSSHLVPFVTFSLLQSSVENECGVSPSDLQAVIIQIKVMSLNTHSYIDILGVTIITM